MRNILKLVIILFASSLLNATTYYVSSSQGNDSNSGTSETNAFKTIDKVRSLTLNPGDNLLFKRGDVWQIEQTLIFSHGGTSTNRIVLGSYGEGLKPVITLRGRIPNSNNPSSWTQTPGYSNVWQMSYSLPSGKSDFTFNVSRMWFDGVEYGEANGLTQDNMDGTGYGINSTNRFFHNLSNHIYYVYATSNPASFYGIIEYPAPPYNNSHTTVIIQSPYITIDGMDIRGGTYSSLGLIGASNCKVINSNIGMDGTFHGIGAMSDDVYGYPSITRSDSVEIANNIIDSGFRLQRYWYEGNWGSGTENGHGIALWGGNYYFDVHDNYVKDWMISIEVSGADYYHKIHDNELTNPDGTYGKPFHVDNEAQATDESACNMYIEFYRNFLHDNAVPSQIMSNQNKFYFNIIENSIVGKNEHVSPVGHASGVYMPSWTGMTKNNTIFNNTFYNLSGPVIYTQASNVFANNLFVDYNRTTGDIDSRYAIWAAINFVTFTNNIFYVPNQTSSSYVNYNSSSNISTTHKDFNSMNNKSGNQQYIGALSSLINVNNFTLPSNSPALDAGVSIEALVPEGFTDRNGIIINRSNPDIGAVQYGTVVTPSPKLVGAALLDSTRLLLTFSEQLSSSGITSLSNYSISNGVIVYSAELNANPAKVTLSTSPHSYGQSYAVNVFNLQSLSGHVISSSSNSVTYLSEFNRPSVGYINKLTIIKTVASSTLDSNYSEEKTIDGLSYSNGGDQNSYWAATPVPQWLIFDLGVAKQISKTKISFYKFQNDRIYTYNISVSNDFVNWVNIAQNSISSNQEWTVNNFTPVIARFVKLEIINNNQSALAGVWETEIWGTSGLQPPLQVKSKNFLQGAYQNSKMSTDLNISTLPLSQPYNTAPWYYNGSESVSSEQPDVVDWIVVELRNNLSASSLVGRRAAFIKSDGTIVDLDGQSPINFYGINSDDYYVVIMHRNHLYIMSANKIALSESSGLYDFTVSPSSSYGNDLANLGNGKYGMYSGDGDINGVVNVLDYEVVGNNLFKMGYLLGDLDLNGVVNVLDYGKANQNLLKVSNVP